MTHNPERVNLFFRLAAVSGAVFVITIFAIVTAVYSETASPAARFLNDRGGQLVAIEVAVTLSFGFLAMTVDRVRTVRTLRERKGSPGAARQDGTHRSRPFDAATS